MESINALNATSKLLTEFRKLKENCHELIEINMAINDLLVVHTDAANGSDMVTTLSRILSEYSKLKDENSELKLQIQDLEKQLKKGN